MSLTAENAHLLAECIDLRARLKITEIERDAYDRDHSDLIRDLNDFLDAAGAQPAQPPDVLRRVVAHMTALRTDVARAAEVQRVAVAEGERLRTALKEACRTEHRDDCLDRFTLPADACPCAPDRAALGGSDGR